MRALIGNRKVWVWAGVWVLTRGLVVAHVGFWNQVTHVQLEDVQLYESWSDHLTSAHSLPSDETWQYPPGAAFLMLLPRLSWASFGTSFVALMLLFDLIGLILLVVLSRREERDLGVWVWLLGMPALRTLPVLRFDLAPTVIGMAALVVIHRRPNWFGALAGLGATIKVWPIVVLFGEWDRRRLLRAAAAAFATIALVFVVSTVAFGDSAGFLGEQNGRGLQAEAVATAPWQVRQIVTGKAPYLAPRSGAIEIATNSADLVASLLKWASLLVFGAAAVWWLARARAIHGGRSELAEAVVSRDFIFTVVLLFVVTSRVLSPQYMIWLLGLSAVVLTANGSNLLRPAWVVVGAVILTTSVYASPDNTLIRNFALLAAAVDASVVMYRLLWPRSASRAADAIRTAGARPASRSS